MCDIGVKQSTGEHPPHFIFSVEPREVLVLETVEGAIPGDLGLLFRVVIDDQYNKHYNVEDGENESDGLYCEPRKKYSEK